MHDDLPAPLTPADCDLRDFPHMPLLVARLRDSRFASHSSGDGFRAGVLLWSASWHQVPAASVPDDDIELSQLAGYGRVSAEFIKVKSEALHGFVLCNDNRWYHTVVATQVLTAWDGKLRYAYKKLDDRLRKENKKRAEDGHELLPVPTFEQWKSEHFPATARFESNGRPSESEAVPAEKKEIPTESGSGSDGTTEDFQRKTLLEGKGKGEGLINTPLTPQGGKRRSADAEESVEFQAFYAAYPRKAGRAAAWKAWQQLAPDAALQATIMGAIAAQHRYVDRRENGRFIPHASTWLNGSRWTDVLPGMPATATAATTPTGEVWFKAAGFEHVAEAENARCHIGNYREFRDGKRIDAEALQ